ncbi:hypothetical protein NFI96_015054, partial [Prochilodus magdalenae]
SSAQAAVADSERIFTELIRSIERNRSEAIKLIRDQERNQLRQTEDLLVKLEQEIADLKRKNTELEQLKHTEDHIHFLQSFQSLSLSSGSEESPSFTVHQQLSFDGVRTSLSDLKERVEKFCKEELSKMSPQVCECRKMAEASIKVDQDQFICPVCLDLLKNPVTIHCGHSFCMVCINGCWDQEDQRRVYSCPQCRETFVPRPVLRRNNMLAEVVERVKKMELQATSRAHCYAGPGDVECDFCTGRKLKAIKSCLVCVASLCEAHLKPHLEIPALIKHKLVEASTRLQEKICSQHDKLMEIYCRTDQSCICYLCLMHEHKGHDTAEAAAERAKKQAKLKEVQRKFQNRLQEKEKKRQESSAQTAVKDSERIFTELIRSIERKRSEVTKLIRAQERNQLSQAEELLVKLEQEIDDLKRRNTELEQLSLTEDHIHFLQNFKSPKVSFGCEDSLSTTVRQHLSFDGVRKSISDLKEQLGEFCKQEFTKILPHAAAVQKPLPSEPTTREDFLQYYCRLTLDPNTVNHSLSLFEKNRMVFRRGGQQRYPDHPERFDSRPQVLSVESVFGRRYWELEWSGWVSISVSYKGISRTGWASSHSGCCCISVSVTCECRKMAGSSISVDQDQFSCAVCLDLLKDPVTIPCGHSFCMACINSCWKHEDQRGGYSCPQCRETFTPRPVLRRNNMMAEVVEKMKKKPEPGDVECDFCTGRKLKAIKSCLVCVASLCEVHLKPHLEIPALIKHKLVEASTRLQEKICSQHDEMMKIYCRTDQSFICYLCTMHEHKGHDTVAAAAERAERQSELKEVQRKFQKRVQEKEKKLQELKQTVNTIKSSAQTAVKDSERIFTELIRSIERKRSEATELIRDQEKNLLSQTEGLLRQLEQEIADLKKRNTELEQLEHTEDHIHFIQTLQSLSVSSGCEESHSITVYENLSFDGVRRSISDLKERLEEFCKKEFSKISASAAAAVQKTLPSEPTTKEEIPEKNFQSAAVQKTFPSEANTGEKLPEKTFQSAAVQKTLPSEPTTREEFLQYYCQLTLDPNTGNHKLSLSEQNRVVTYNEEQYNEVEHRYFNRLERFDYWRQVLCKESMSGRCYWEVEWNRGPFGASSISVSYKGISRKGGGNGSKFGHNAQSWSLEYSPAFAFYHNNIQTELSGPSSSRIGVYVDHSAGTLSFYNVADTMTLLHRIHNTFTQPLYAGFRLGPGSSLKLCDPVMKRSSEKGKLISESSSLSVCECRKMAEASISVDHHQFVCPVCLDLLKDPVTIHCGHSYCMVCINGFWDQDDQTGVYSCPQCRETFTPRPVLRRNNMMVEMLEKMKKTELQTASPPAHSPTGPGYVECDFCTGRKLKAIRSCLVCLASYCETHVLSHYQSPAFEKHQLVEASTRLQEKICSQHGKLMEIYCRTDQSCVCYLCTMHEHKGHDTVAAVAERAEKQSELKEVQGRSQQRLQEKERELQEVKQTVITLKSSAQAAVKDSERIFTELIRSIERKRSEVIKLIRDQERNQLSQSEELLEKLEQEIADLKRRNAELEQLEHTEGSFQALSVSSGCEESRSFTVYENLSFDGVRRSISDLKERLEEFCKEELTPHAGAAQKTLPSEPTTREEFLQYYCELTLDPNTVNHKLSLSEKNRVVTFRGGQQRYSDHPERFDCCRQVLCRESVSGRSYWEVEWSRELLGVVTISVSYKGISRDGDGNLCKFGHNAQSWSLQCSPFTFWHNNIQAELSGPSSSRVGVYVDHSAGTLSFYSVSDTMTLLHRVHSTFTQPLYAGFGIGPGCMDSPEGPVTSGYDTPTSWSPFDPVSASHVSPLLFLSPPSRCATLYTHDPGCPSYSAQRRMPLLLSLSLPLLVCECRKMAEARMSVDQDQFSCPVCLELLEDPVTIPCGHRYCMVCVNRHWDQDDERGVYSCPQCRETFTSRPVLHRNNTMVEMLEKLKKKPELQAAASPPADRYAGPGDVECDFCTGRKLKAIKSCLVCVASLCEAHLKPHLEIPALIKHKLVEASTRLQEKICSQHDKLMEIYCRTDQSCICYLCTMHEHKGHDTVAAAAERAGKQNDLKEVQRRSQQRLQEKEKKLQEVKQTVNTIKSSAQTAVEDSERIFTELIRSIERKRSEVMKLIRDQERTQLSQTEDLLEKLEEEIADLKRRNTELEQLEHTEDPIQFLQSFQSLSVSSSRCDDFPFPHLSFDGVRKALSDLKERLEELCKEELSKMSPQDYCQLTLDPNTVNHDLSLSEQNRVVTWRGGGQRYSDHPERFDYWNQVLCRESVSGRCYWEVEWNTPVKGLFSALSWVTISVSYKGIRRKGDGKKSKFGRNSQSWSLECSSILTFWYNSIQTELPYPSSSRVGVYVDHSAGTLSFYSVSDTMTLLHTVHTTFTQPLYAGFGVGLRSSAKLCDSSLFPVWCVLHLLGPGGSQRGLLLPQCRETFTLRPVLRWNNMMAGMLEKVKKPEFQAASPLGPGDVECDSCTGRKLKAIRSCLVCLASYCETHVQSHYQSPAFEKHQLVEASTRVQEKICPQHGKLMEIYCQTDQSYVCYLCTMHEHKGHDTVAAAAERAGRQSELREVQRRSHQRLQEKEKKLQEVKKTLITIKSSAQTAVEDSERIFAELIRSIERKHSEVIKLIRDQERNQLSQTEELLEKLEQEMDELKMRNTELEQLEHTEDPIQFLQRFRSFSVSSGCEDSASITIHQELIFDGVRKSISELKERVDEWWKEDLGKILPHAEAAQRTLPSEPTTREEFLQYYCQLTLDPTTVNHSLDLSEKNRVVRNRGGEQCYPDHPDRFDSRTQVLCKESVCGRCYWEVECNRVVQELFSALNWVAVSVSYKGISRKGWGDECVFGCNAQSWSLVCSSSLTFWHNNVRTEFPGPSPSRIGVYVDHRAGTLSFYSVSDTMTLLHTVHTTFTQPLYAGLEVVGLGSSAQLCDPGTPTGPPQSRYGVVVDHSQHCSDTDVVVVVPADGAVGVEVEGHQVFWTRDNKLFLLMLTTVPPHTDSLGVSTKTKAGLVTEDDPLPF